MDNNFEEKYNSYYQPNDLYWGIGIENETYFVTENSVIRTGEYVKKNRRRERYSVDYSVSYDQNKLNEYLNKIFFDNDEYNVPVYINSHSLSKTDSNGEHQTLYTVGKKINPKFNGKTIHELLRENYKNLINDYDDKYVFDGDTIEFITKNFYKTTVNDTVKELVDYKNNFLNKLNSVMIQFEMPKVLFPKVNFGLVHFATNPNNISMFNNGTYHINLTLPTQLDKFGKIADFPLFERHHKNAIEIIKWFEPFITALYGSPDVFSFEDNNRYSGGSLRLTASRYVSIGTYDTNTMRQGKQLNDLRTTMFIYLYDNSWYNKVYKLTDYKQVDHIGYDINYAKHMNLGIEFRILDYFPEEALGDFINFIILLLDHSLQTNIKISATDSIEWHDFTTDVLIRGHLAEIPISFIKLLSKFLNLPTINETSISVYMKLLSEHLHKTYKNNICSKLMSPNMPVPVLYNINQYMWENNYLQYVPINNKNHIRVTKLYDTYCTINTNKINFISTNKYHILLKNTGLLTIKNLDLEKFYEKLLVISREKLLVNKYII
ncbi:hypothetical protein QLL95_gp1236 [Cotonvirus japonicus]|uniref:Uncharacterized protein n=1 Tax=Cotonvirus japonicus TaxID=2811091 RepID=A0ABM7NS16_9VIRU|nr:hypothetical protein QLL95_gp1236 [Cotonvirus japonicus]BCS82887.1 hypothetical protein [Cotonvirus japonicus]